MINLQENNNQFFFTNNNIYFVQIKEFELECNLNLFWLTTVLKKIF